MLVHNNNIILQLYTRIEHLMQVHVSLLALVNLYLLDNGYTYPANNIPVYLNYAILGNTYELEINLFTDSGERHKNKICNHIIAINAHV